MSKTTKSNIIGLKELRENFPDYIQDVSKGQSFVVVKRSQPVFRIVPIKGESEDIWEQVIDLTQINPDGVPASQVLRAINKLV